MPIESYPWVAHRRGVIYDALHLFVHPDGYRLSDRVWRSAVKTRSAIDKLLVYHIRNGTAAVDIAKELEKFLAREARGRTLKPYGRWGSYEARRLARTEITAALGRGTIAAAQANPFVNQIEWALSPDRTGEWVCNCEANAEASPYDVNSVPSYPDHPHCMCTLRPITISTDEAVKDIRAWLAGGESQQEYESTFSMTGVPFDQLELWGMKGTA